MIRAGELNTLNLLQVKINGSDLENLLGPSRIKVYSKYFTSYGGKRIYQYNGDAFFISILIYIKLLYSMGTMETKRICRSKQLLFNYL